MCMWPRVQAPPVSQMFCIFVVAGKANVRSNWASSLSPDRRSMESLVLEF